jgi:WD40 repeat protein
MPRFTISQMMMGFVLAALLISLFLADGCGKRYSRIECISFSPDGSKLVVSRLNARDAREFGKSYSADLARTITVISADTGKTIKNVHQDFRPGNMGPAIALWNHISERTTVIFANNGEVIAHRFGGGELSVYPIATTGGSRTLDKLDRQFEHLHRSPDGKYIVALEFDSISIIDVRTYEQVAFYKYKFEDSLHDPRCSFDPDSKQLCVFGWNRIDVFDLNSNLTLEKSFSCPTPEDDLNVFRDVTFANKNSMFIAGLDGGLVEYDESGKTKRTLKSDQMLRLCELSSDHTRIATGGNRKLVVHETSTGKELLSRGFGWNSALAFRPDSYDLVVGDGDGTITLIDTSTSKEKWSITAPGRYRLPWTVPAGLVALWCVVAYRMWKRKQAKISPLPKT